MSIPESDWDPEDQDDVCEMCGGDGVVALSECGPSEWGEDCFCEEDSIVQCPKCRDREREKKLKIIESTPEGLR